MPMRFGLFEIQQTFLDITGLQKMEMINLETADSLYNLLQITDSTFPTGGFSHSGGCEAALRHGIITSTNAASLDACVRQCVENTCSLQSPFVRVAWQTMRGARPGTTESTSPHLPLTSADHNHKDASCESDTLALAGLRRVEDTLHISMNNHIARRASCQQGKSLAASAAATFPDTNQLRALGTWVESSGLRGHHAIVFGSVCALLDVGLDATVQAFVFTTTRAALASLVRLGHAGPMHAQCVLRELHPWMRACVAKYAWRDLGQVCIAAPVLDVAQNAHDTMFSKLFYS